MILRGGPVELVLRSLTKTYGAVTAVADFTLEIGAGHMVALLGPSGCGKTTTLRMIAGLVRPTRGQILIGGRDVSALPVHRRNIGMLFQSYALFPHLTVAQNIAFGLEMRGVGRAERDRRVSEALRLVALDGLAERMPRALSGGQQQRVALARALVIEPSVLLLDEPLGALDKGLRETMQVELRQLQQRLGITTVIVTHDQEEALTLADRIVIMRGGRIEQAGPPDEIYTRPLTRFVASFIGAANFLQARVSLRASDRTELVMACGARLRVAGPVSGETVTVALRPEAIHVETLAEAVTPGPNAACATIEQRIYRGALTHLYLRLDGGATLLAFRNNRIDETLPDLAPGARVLARWADGQIRVVAER